MTTTRPAAKKTTTTRRAVKQPADRKAAAAARASVEVPGIEALHFDSSKTVDDADVVKIFSIDDTDYYVPREPRANVTLKYLRMARTDPANAQGWLLEQLLGEESYTALMEYEALTKEELLHVLAIVEKLANDAAGATSGPLGRG